jgi:hypothetical protein
MNLISFVTDQIISVFLTVDKLKPASPVHRNVQLAHSHLTEQISPPGAPPTPASTMHHAPTALPVHTHHLTLHGSRVTIANEPCTMYDIRCKAMLIADC